MIWFLGALGLLVTGACLSALLPSNRQTSWISASTAVAASVIGIVQSVAALYQRTGLHLQLPWHFPFSGEICFLVDPLAAFFLLCIFLLVGMTAIFGLVNTRDDAASVKRFHGFNFNLLAASMVLVVTAHHAWAFLVAWEIMGLTSFFLILTDHRQKATREAAWIYLVATQIGATFLFVMFALMGHQAGGFAFDTIQDACAGIPPHTAGIWFILALVGFGTKAGFFPLHVWLPEAHPAAPSHISALLSGVMIKTGIYGILRVLTFFDVCPPWWGYALLAIGIVSGLAAMLFAIAQHDLKRLLAYSSIENIGIIAIGTGLGVLGLAYGNPVMAGLGFAGALLHVLNHGIFKGLLFMAAGAVYHATGKRTMDDLGGLMKTMPCTGMAFLGAALSICGLPPFNGFISEFLIYAAAFSGLSRWATPFANGSMVAVILGLVMIGGLAVITFTKAFGITFLGAPRNRDAGHAHEPPFTVQALFIVMALACLAIGLAAPWIINFFAQPVAQMAALPAQATGDILFQAGILMANISTISCCVIILVSLLACLRYFLLARREVRQGCTWDCGYRHPSARMQYTSSSFAQPVTAFFRIFIRSRRTVEAPQGLFPEKGASFSSHTPDLLSETFYKPLFAAIRNTFTRLRPLQSGRIQLYVLYILLTLFILLGWQMLVQP